MTIEMFFREWPAATVILCRLKLKMICFLFPFNLEIQSSRFKKPATCGLFLTGMTSDVVSLAKKSFA